MLMITKKGQINTEELGRRLSNLEDIAKAMGQSPKHVEELEIGHVIVLDGYEEKNWESFDLRTIAFVTNSGWYEYMPTMVSGKSWRLEGSIRKYFAELDEKAKDLIGEDWRVVVYRMPTNLETDLKEDLDGFRDTILDALDNLGAEEKSILTVRYGASESIATNIIKLVNSGSDSYANPVGECYEIVYEMLHYDEYMCKMIKSVVSTYDESFNIRIHRDTSEYKVPTLFSTKIALDDIDSAKGNIDLYGDGEYVAGLGVSLEGCLLYGINCSSDAKFISFPRGYDMSASFKAKYFK